MGVAKGAATKMIHCERIARDLGGLFDCTEINGYVRVRTPFLYPDGQVIDLFYAAGPQGGTASDLGETLGWFRMQTDSRHRSERQQRFIDAVCRDHGIELIRGCLVARVDGPGALPDTVTRAARACLRLSEQLAGAA